MLNFIHMKDLRRSLLRFFNFRKIAPILLVIGIVLGFFWKTVLRNQIPIPGDFVVGVYYPWLDYKWGLPTGVPVKNPIMADVVSFSFPMRILGVTMMKGGQLPLWNPYILMGTPLLANFQSAPFSPTNVVYFLFDKLTAWSVQIILQHILAAVFVYLLLRHWKAGKAGSILGGVVFAFSGFNLIWSQWNAHTLVASFIPLLILFVDKFLVEKKIVYGISFSVVLVMQILSGYPQIVFYSFAAVGILWLVRKKSWFATFFLAIFVVIGLGLAAFQILPGYELLKFSQRAIEPHPFEWAFLPWSKIVTFLAPDYFGNHATANYWGPQDYTSNTGFVGVVAFVLAFLTIPLIKRKKEVLYLFAVCVVSLLLSFPTPLSIALWESGVLGFQAAAAHRALVLFTFSISVLAGLGLDSLIGRTRQKILALAATFLILAGFGVFAFSIHNSVALRNLVLPTVVLVLTALFVFLRFKYGLIVLSIFELFYFGWKFTPFSPRSFVFPETPVISFLKNQQKPFRTTGDHVIPINFRMAYDIETVEGYDAVYPVSATEVINRINDSPNTFRRYAIVDNDTSNLLDLVDAKYYLALKTDPNLKRFDAGRFKVAFEDKSVVVYESKTAKPRAFLENQNIPVDYVSHKETESVIRINSRIDDKLFVSDTYYPGWKAYVDGQEAKIYLADFAFRAIKVPKGKHEIRMVYRPDSFFNGLKISLYSLVFLVSLLILKRYTKLIS